MKKIVLRVLLGLFVCAFSACSSDDNNGPNFNPDNKEAQIATYLWENEYRIITLKEITRDIEERVTKLIIVSKSKTDNDEITTEQRYTYRKDSVFMVKTENGYTRHVNAKLDEEGKIVSANDDYGVFKFYYVNGNQLSHVHENSQGSDYDTFITWGNGNIFSVNASSVKTDYTYTDYPATHFLKINDWSMALPDIITLDPILFKQGFYGTYPKNLVSNYTRQELVNENGEDKQVERTHTLTYTLDSKKNVTKITYDQGTTETYTWK
mgnify:CR=1 FL=1